MLHLLLLWRLAALLGLVLSLEFGLSGCGPLPDGVGDVLCQLNPGLKCLSIWLRILRVVLHDRLVVINGRNPRALFLLGDMLKAADVLRLDQLRLAGLSTHLGQERGGIQMVFVRLLDYGYGRTGGGGCNEGVVKAA